MQSFISYTIVVPASFAICWTRWVQQQIRVVLREPAKIFEIKVRWSALGGCKARTVGIHRLAQLDQKGLWQSQGKSLVNSDNHQCRIACSARFRIRHLAALTALAACLSAHIVFRHAFLCCCSDRHSCSCSAAVSGVQKLGVRQLRAVAEYFSLVWKSKIVGRTVGR